MSEPLKSPYPYFGGKSAVAPLLWRRFGHDATNYIEPFFGSGITLLARPQPFGGVETVNDLDCYLTNFWRSIKADPETTAAYADGPVNELDLHARHRYLVLSDDAGAFREQMRADPHYYDPKFAGWWVWGLCQWIGSGWCDASRIERDAGTRPKISEQGAHGVHKRPRGHRAAGSSNGPCNLPGVLGGPTVPMRTGGRPQLADAYDVGRGVHASPPSRLSQQLPMIGTGGQGDGTIGVLRSSGGSTCAERRAWLLDWFGRLADRLRNVRVCCGHWSRVCSSPSVLTRLGPTAAMLDPPYPKQQGAKKSRAGNLYASDSDEAATPESLRDEILAWCSKWGRDPLMRVAVCGYEGDGYEVLVNEAGWREEAWKASGGYGNRSESGKANACRERIWFSPHCCYERTLFDYLDPKEGN